MHWKFFKGSTFFLGETYSLKTYCQGSTFLLGNKYWVSTYFLDKKYPGSTFFGEYFLTVTPGLHHEAVDKASWIRPENNEKKICLYGGRNMIFVESYIGYTYNP